MDFENELDDYQETEPQFRSRLDSVWLGLIIGILAPVLGFMMFYASSFTQVSFGYFIRYSLKIGALINILTVSLIPDFIVFALFIWRKHYSSAKGVVIASATFTALFVILKVLIALYFK